MLGSVIPPNVALIKNWVYVVQPNDTLASITKLLAGNANRYYELVGANPQKEKTTAPRGFRYHFFKELVEGERLNVPGNWRSKEAAFGIGNIYDGTNINDIMNQVNQYAPLLNNWYNTNAGTYQLPPLNPNQLTILANVLAGWQPYITPAIQPTDIVQYITPMLSNLLTPEVQAQVLSMIQQAANLVSVTGSNSIPPNIASTLPWGNIPWGSLNQWIPIFNQSMPNGGFYDYLSMIPPLASYVPPSTQIPSIPPYVNWGMGFNKEIFATAGVGVGDAQFWNPADVNAVDPTVLNNIPWDKIGSVNWPAAVAAIQKWGAGTPADIQATKACWQECVIDINQATVDDFFHDVNVDPKHGCCRWKCVIKPECVGSQTLTCPPGVFYNNQCVSTCPNGTVWNADNNTCESPTTPSLECDSTHPCATGYDCTANNKCVKQGGAQEKLPLPTGYHCPTGSNWDSVTGHCKDGKGNIVQAVKDDSSGGTPPKDNTVLYVIAGLIGVLIIGGTIVAISGKEKPAEKLATSSA